MKLITLFLPLVVAHADRALRAKATTKAPKVCPVNRSTKAPGSTKAPRLTKAPKSTKDTKAPGTTFTGDDVYAPLYEYINDGGCGKADELTFPDFKECGCDDVLVLIDEGLGSAGTFSMVCCDGDEFTFDTGVVATKPPVTTTTSSTLFSSTTTTISTNSTISTTTTVTGPTTTTIAPLDLALFLQIFFAFLQFILAQIFAMIVLQPQPSVTQQDDLEVAGATFKLRERVEDSPAQPSWPFF